MTRREAIYDIITILRKFGYSDDDALDEDYIGFKIDEKRAKEIRDSYNRNPKIDPRWIQDYGIIDLTEINTADDRTLTFLNCKLFKYTLPPTVAFYNSKININNLGIYGIFSADLKSEYYYQAYSDFVMRMTKLSENHPAHLYKYYTQLNRSIYSSSPKLRAQLILERPLDGYVIESENVVSGELTNGDTFEVITGQIMHDTVLYSAGQTFVAVSPGFTGTGTVQYLNQKRKMTDEDEYPLSNSQMEIVILKILTQEFKIEESQIIDYRNNSQDKSKQSNQGESQQA